MYSSSVPETWAQQIPTGNLSLEGARGHTSAKMEEEVSKHASLGTLSENKNGIMWEKFPSGGPPPPTPPVWEFSHFFTVFVKLVMPFYKLLNWKKQ